jgi:cytoplasmic iron level regulating protein YaaA (DUF328/UPF0246 family)
MELVLITCCKTKAPGGRSEYQPSDAIQESLSTKSYNNLLKARRDLAELLGEAPGPDLGSNESTSGLSFLPAYQRYIGKVYRAGQVEELYPESRVRLTIISALYGLVDAGDLIRDYNLRMDWKTDTKTVAAFWKERGLGKILCEYINHVQPGEVHDLLTNLYRKAIKPWPVCADEGIWIETHRYPNQGIWALLHRRGKDLEKLLRGQC